LKIFSLKEEASRRERREVAMRHSKLAQQYREAHKRGEPGVLSPSQTLSSSKSLLHMVRQQSVQQNRRSFFEKKSSRGSFCGGSGGKHDSPSLLSMNSSASMRARSRTSSDVSMRQIDAFINNKVDDIREKLLDDTIDVDAIGVGGPLVDGDDLSSSSSEDDEDSLMDGDSSSDDDETYDDDIVQLDGDAFDDEFAKFTPKKIESNEAQEMAEWNHIIVGADLSHRLISSSDPEGDATPGSGSSSYNPAMGVKYAKHEDIVTRSYMEDRSYACVNIPGCGEDFRPLALFAVFDGHSGDYVAAHLQNQYVNVFTNVLKDVERDAQMQHFSFEARMEKVFEETNLKIDRELLEKDFQRQQKNIKSGIQDIQTYAGSVAAVAVVVPFIPSIQSVYNIKSGVEVFISHIGDCRAVLSRDGQAIQLTEDHKPTVRSERNRIEMAGGWVQNGRVNGGLGVSRSFGDIQFKSFSHCTGFVGDETSPRGIWGVHQQVISKPDFYHFIVDDSSYEFMILASDGLWDVFPSQDAVNFVRKRLVTDRDLNKAAQALVQKAIQKGTQDNTSVVIVAFNQ
jgi:protein phosphatase 2C family protein 2/3